MKAANPSEAMALVIVDELVRFGIVHACLAPGQRSAALALALEEDDRIELHVVHDERSAAFLALGIAKATGFPVPVVSTSGSAPANFHPAVIEAAQGRVPLLLLTADRPNELRATGSNQTTDQIKLYGDAVRWFHEMGVPDEDLGAPRYWRSVVARALHSSTHPMPGPVHLNLAFRDPLTSDVGGSGYPHVLGGRDNEAPWVSVSAGAVPGPSTIERLAVRVLEAERGLLVVGAGVGDPGAAVLFAEATGWPMLAEAHSGARTGSCAISTYDALARSDRFTGERPDLVVRVGRTTTSKALPRYLDDAEQIVIDPSPFDMDPTRSMSVAMVADAGLLLRAVAGRLDTRPATEWLAHWQSAEVRVRKAIDDALDGGGLSEPRIARDAARSLADGSTLVVASSMPVRDLDNFMAPRGGLDMVSNRGASGIDGFVSTALGTALAASGGVTALAGDLSILHDQNGFLLTRSEPVDCTFVVVNNDGGGIFSFLPQAQRAGAERVFGTPHGIDFAHLAAVYELGYQKIESPDELEAAISAAPEGVRILEVVTDRAQNRSLHADLSALAAAAAESF